MLVEVLISIVFIILTCIIIWRSSDGFETASEYLGRNMSEGVRGATINAIGSSMPELLTTMFFLFVLRDKDGFAGGIGTTAGSAVFNGVIIPALVIFVVVGYGIAKKVKVSRKVVLRDGISLILAELLLILFIGGNSLDWWQGLILMLIYGIYVTYMLTSMKRSQRAAALEKGEEAEEEEEEEEEEEKGEKNPYWSALTLDFEPLVVPKEMKTLNAWILLLLSMSVIAAACFLLVHSCERLGDAIGIPIYFVAVVLASAATSVPDTLLSIRDAMKGNYDDAVSNAIGSNIFDICFALGLPLFLFTLINGPISMSADTVHDVAELRILLVVITVVAVAIFYFGKGMGRGSALILFSLYILFTAYILGDPDIFDYNTSLSTFFREVDATLNPLRFWLK